MLLNFGTRLDGHQFLYDEETLRAQLLAAGFTDVVRRPFGHSEHDDLRGIEHHDGGATGGAWTHEVQLVVEARRA
jgi:hypothetical protein